MGNKKQRNKAPKWNEASMPDMAMGAAATAFIFLEACERTEGFKLGPDGFMRNPFAATLVLAAFSVETAFKSLLLHSGRRMSGHALLPLFHALTPEQRERIFLATGVDRARFERGMVEMNRGFEEWRYLYERQTWSIDGEFPLILARAAVRILREPHLVPSPRDSAGAR